MTFRVTLLDASHDRASFQCGKPSLDEYLHRQARQDVDRKACTCFILSEDGVGIMGYYTLSSASIDRPSVPVVFDRRLPPYRVLPVVLIGRLAVGIPWQGRQLGAFLLMDALHRILVASTRHVGACAVVTDPLDEGAERFYRKYGFERLHESGRMMLPMKTISQLPGLPRP